MKYFVYIVECKGGSFYCGYTNNLERRIEEHNNSKKGAWYTRWHRPVRLIYYEEFETKSDAMKREYEIKQLERKEKEKLVKNNC